MRPAIQIILHIIQALLHITQVILHKIQVIPLRIQAIPPRIQAIPPRTQAIQIIQVVLIRNQAVYIRPYQQTVLQMPVVIQAPAVAVIQDIPAKEAIPAKEVIQAKGVIQVIAATQVKDIPVKVDIRVRDKDIHNIPAKHSIRDTLHIIDNQRTLVNQPVTVMETNRIVVQIPL